MIVNVWVFVCGATATLRRDNTRQSTLQLVELKQRISAL